METTGSEYELNSFYSSGITTLLDKNLLISSNELLQGVSEEKMEHENNQSEAGFKENEDKQINCPKRPSTSDDFITEHILKRRRV